MPYQQLASPRPPSDRRQKPRWRDKRLLVLCCGGQELPGMTGDISGGGMQLALPHDPCAVGEQLSACVAFSQHLMEILGTLVYARRRPWGVLAGIRYEPKQEALLRYLGRRYPQRPLAPFAPAYPLTSPPPEPTKGLHRSPFTVYLAGSLNRRDER